YQDGSTRTLSPATRISSRASRRPRCPPTPTPTRSATTGKSACAATTTWARSVTRVWARRSTAGATAPDAACSCAPRVRPSRRVRAAVVAAGLREELRRPMLVLLNAPVDTRSRAARAAWWTLRTAALRGEAAGWLAGAAAYPFEVGLARVLREGPSTELMVCRRPVAG